MNSCCILVVCMCVFICMYMHVSLISVISKIFTKILNERLNLWADNAKIKYEEQAGFRVGYSTVDQIFNLYSLISKYVSKKKGRCYVLFVDFSSAFDCSPHFLLWFKLIKSGVHGNILKVLRSMYENLKTCIRTP